MTLPRLSVIIPNYNHARFLPNCLEAILRQSEQPFEIIVIDDASTDNSVEVIEAFTKRNPIIRFYRNEQNRGVVSGMNRGLELARGDYVYYAAADDQVLPGFFEKSLRLLNEHPQAALCCTIGDWREIETGFNWHVGVGKDRKSTRLNSSHGYISYAVFCLKKKNKIIVYIIIIVYK